MTRAERTFPRWCVLCSHNCGLARPVEDGRIVPCWGHETNPITKGYVWQQGLRHRHYVEHGDRVRHPLRRVRRAPSTRSTGRRRSPSPTRLNEIRLRHSPRAIALVRHRPDRATTWTRPTRWLPPRHRSAPLVHGCRAEKTQHSLLESVDCSMPPRRRSPRRHGPLTLPPRARDESQDLDRGQQCDRQPSRCWPRTPGYRGGGRSARDRDGADGDAAHLRVKPGTDVYLLLAMAAVMVCEGLADEAFVAVTRSVRASSAPSWRRSTSPTLAARCGLAVDDIVERRAVFARGSRRPSSTAWASSRRRSPPWSRT